MVEFEFDIKPLFPEEIIKITWRDFCENNPSGEGKRWLKNSRLETIIDHMGKLSAVAQGLKEPITTADKMKKPDNTTLYMMAAPNNEKNSVVGLLKVGKKDLFLYDEEKQQRKVQQVPCVLDFYVYEACQRSGYGKRLFEEMLREENWNPNKCSIDRPSEKLKSFLKKHYGLDKTIPQGYRFVLYQGFFEGLNDKIIQEAPTSSSQSNQFDPSYEPPAYEPPQTSISLEHFGGCLDVLNMGCNAKKLEKNCPATPLPYGMIQMRQALNKRY